MRRWAAGLLLLVAFGVPAQAHLVALDAAAQGDRLCSAVVSPPPVLTDVKGCDRAWCAAAGDERVCVCETGAGSDAPRFQYLRGDRRWRAEVSPMLGPEAFALTRADVDGDRRDDWLLEQRMGVSNGMGVVYSRLCTWVSSSGALVCRDVEEWGSLSVLVHEGQRGVCSLVDSGWLTGGEPGRGPGRGEGTYDVGRVWRFERGTWRVATARPAVARRLLRSFDDERETLPERNRERLWYQSPQARSLRCPDRLCTQAPIKQITAPTLGR